MKFLDDYQRNKLTIDLFTRRLNERRQMTMEEVAVNPVHRFRQTFDLLEKQLIAESREGKRRREGNRKSLKYC